MGLLLDAARTWDSLSHTVYNVEVGRKGKQFSIELSFAPADFPHMAGMQYAKDVSFGLRPAQYYGDQLIPMLLSRKMNDLLIMKSRSWNKIEGRLKAIVNLKNTLEGEFVIAQFFPERVHGFCSIQAEYVIKNTVSQEVFFVFLDQESGRYYCKSAFQSDDLDYTENQPILTVLEVTKSVSGAKILLRRHPSYKQDTSCQG
jgi:hypothetical protein